MSQAENTPFQFIQNDPFEGLAMRRLGRISYSPALSYMLVLAVAYVPLLILSILEGTFNTNATITFIKDFGLQFRFLLAVPLLVFSRPVIKMATSTTCLYIHDVLLDKSERERTFLPALEKIRTLNKSGISKVVLISVVVILATLLYYFTTHNKKLVSVSGWYGSMIDNEFSPSKAFLWYNLVSISIFRFILLRWFWSYCCWIWLIKKVAGSNLKLTPTHSDKACGLNMLVFPQSRFNLFFVALAITSSGKLINDVLYRQVAIESVRIEALILICISFIMLLGPYLLFMSKLFRARIQAQINMNKKSHQLSEDFDRNWVHTTATGEDDRHKPDPSVMIDYYSTYEYTEKIRPFPFSGRNLIGLAIPIVLVYLPVLLTKMSVKELLQIVLKLVV
jgi:hypothetical protein